MPAVRDQVLWGGRTVALHADAQELERHALDSVWFVLLTGFCRMWLGVDGKPTVSILEARLVARDDARALLAQLQPAGAVAVAAGPITDHLHQIILRSHRAKTQATAQVAAHIEPEPEPDLWGRRRDLD